MNTDDVWVVIGDLLGNFSIFEAVDALPAYLPPYNDLDVVEKPRLPTKGCWSLRQKKGSSVLLQTEVKPIATFLEYNQTRIVTVISRSDLTQYGLARLNHLKWLRANKHSKIPDSVSL